ncbi:Asp-tRNA(Asn)/Glu-tRNA(Gln) amidotransferase subunit GatB [Patescibacteria group bacterium]|nr:Asp-tRNA(Asn)/Glu-tRNA(Gln) amidotransferase subunit GatB [Patescibacteria group bacterium]
MNLEPVIGLEIHVQLKTKSKMFCGCSNRGEYENPNTTICPVCTGQPGVLPVINKEAVKMGVLASLALNCRINEHSKFDRKHYFYPDLPKGYQISQFDLPVGETGFLEIDVPTKEGVRTARIGITRLHMEEDAAKNNHNADKTITLVDYNRGGTPLAEIVSEPDIRSPQEAKIFLQELRKIMRYLGVSDADMEKGQLRCDANISMREYVEKAAPDEGWAMQLNPKTEIKNLNSFRSVERALEYEIARQTKHWEDTGLPSNVQTTRGWDDAKGVTTEQRTKEGSSDYRYFPEPDLPPMELAEIRDKQKEMLPELPRARKYRFMDEYGFSMADAEILTEDPYKAEYTERALSELISWLMSMPNIEGTETEIWDKYGEKMAKLYSGWFINKLGGIMAQNAIDIRILKITPENFAEFIILVYENKISGPNALKLLEMMTEAGGDPSQLIDKHDLGAMKEDEGEMDKIIEKVVNEHQAASSDYKAGKQTAIMFLVGQVMKESKGKANPEVAKEMLIEKIEK